MTLQHGATKEQAAIINLTLHTQMLPVKLQYHYGPYAMHATKYIIQTIIENKATLLSLSSSLSL